MRTASEKEPSGLYRDAQPEVRKSMKNRWMMIFTAIAALACGAYWPAGSVAAAEQRVAPQVAGTRPATDKHPAGAASGQNRPGTGAKADARKKKALHGNAWAFGQSDDRDAAIWRQGMPVRSLHDRAVSKAGVKKKAMNTAPGIDNALNEAAGSKKKKSGLALSVDNETSTWRERLPTETARPDEILPLESRHVVRAFADLETGEDLSISVGPELILKDEQNRDHSASNSQPDSALGLGMQFKLDF